LGSEQAASATIDTTASAAPARWRSDARTAASGAFDDASGVALERASRCVADVGCMSSFLSKLAKA
jgi:hypothetical protein